MSLSESVGNVINNIVTHFLYKRILPAISDFLNLTLYHPLSIIHYIMYLSPKQNKPISYAISKLQLTFYRFLSKGTSFIMDILVKINISIMQTMVKPMLTLYVPAIISSNLHFYLTLYL